MGCTSSREKGADDKRICKPKPFKHPEPITRERLKQMREEFWDTAPHYGGTKARVLLQVEPPSLGGVRMFALAEIWDALKAASETELPLAQAIIDSAGIIVQNPDLTICYDERGARYELPKYVLSEPSNLIRDS